MPCVTPLKPPPRREPDPGSGVSPARSSARTLTLATLAALGLGAPLPACGGSDADPPAVDMTMQELGEALFSDPNLSRNRTMSCATCHNPEHAFIDDRLDAEGNIAAVSRGDDGVSLGDRNAPTAAYAALSAPEARATGTRSRHNKQTAHRTYEGPLGGLFLDGRASGLADQAAGPPLNPLEMGMPDAAAVVARLQENPTYVAAFRALFSEDVFDDVNAAYAAMTEAIAAFEQTERFSPFDAKYDRYLRGEATLSFMELTGRSLFFSQFANCGICHQLHSNGDPVNKLRETFTGYEYHNIGVPPNARVRAQNGVTKPDRGLAPEDAAADDPHRGKFKVPTLRNVAVTEPYMHNGVFRDLRTTILFYEHYVDPEGRAVNPETGEPWRAPEVEATVSEELLRVGDGMSDLQVDALVCFLRTLTDARYEHLIEAKGIDCAD